MSDTSGLSDILGAMPARGCHLQDLIKKTEPVMGPVFCLYYSYSLYFFSRRRLLRHHLKHGSFELMLNGNHSILRLQLGSCQQ